MKSGLDSGNVSIASWLFISVFTCQFRGDVDVTGKIDYNTNTEYSMH